MRSRKPTNAFLGVDTEFEGRLVFSGELEINGGFRGEIAASGCLTVGPDAVISADVHVDIACIHGSITGNVMADHRLEIFPGGRVVGDIQSPEVILHDGGTFEGGCCTQPPEVCANDVQEPDVPGVHRVNQLKR